MKQSPADRQAFERMMPGVITAQGFLGKDVRSPDRIIAEDEVLFCELGLDFDTVADRLEELARKGEEGLGEPITVGKLLIQSGEARGKLPCPWGDGFFHKNAVSVSPADIPLEACAEGEDMLIYSELSIHMLRAHHFCQGRGSPFRLEPALLKQLLF
ncbi:MAG: hypothetical protein QHH01_04645 [Spirochaetales bacterium]|jgi:hypothetical protein|nr:hypothetical protein [Spirochaetales bacterium]